MENNDLVLVVDDNADCRELLRIALRAFRIPVISARDGRQALDLAIASQPALIFMDLNMPEMNGFDATRAIHTHPDGKRIPIVAVSAYDSKIQKERALDAGCIEFLKKPLELSDLLRILKDRIWLSLLSLHARRQSSGKGLIRWDRVCYSGGVDRRFSKLCHWIGNWKCPVRHAYTSLRAVLKIATRSKVELISIFRRHFC
jgi:two-component system, cell cycle response regulator DivK